LRAESARKSTQSPSTKLVQDDSTLPVIRLFFLRLFLRLKNHVITYTTDWSYAEVSGRFCGRIRITLPERTQILPVGPAEFTGAYASRLAHKFLFPSCVVAEFK